MNIKRQFIIFGDLEQCLDMNRNICLKFEIFVTD